MTKIIMVMVMKKKVVLFFIIVGKKGVVWDFYKHDEFSELLPLNRPVMGFLLDLLHRKKWVSTGQTIFQTTLQSNARDLESSPF